MKLLSNEVMWEILDKAYHDNIPFGVKHASSLIARKQAELTRAETLNEVGEAISKLPLAKPDYYSLTRFDPFYSVPISFVQALLNKPVRYLESEEAK